MTTLTPEETSAIRKLIEISQLLSEEGKQLYLNFLDAGEPYADEFLGAVAMLMESEEEYIQTEGVALEKKIEDLKKEAQKQEQELQKKSDLIREKLPQEFEKEAKKTIGEIKKIDEHFDQEAEKLVHNAEENQADSIRQSLQTPK